MMKFISVYLGLFLLMIQGVDGVEKIGIGILQEGSLATESSFNQANGGTICGKDECWNFIVPSVSGITTLASLKTTANSPTSANLAAKPGFCTSNRIFSPGKNRDFCLMDSWAGFRDTENLVIAGLPASMTEYCDVVIYGDSDTNARDMFYTVNGVTKKIEDRNLFTGTLTEGGNVVTFHYVPVVAGKVTITGNQSGVSGRSAINALLVSSASPGVISFAAAPEAIPAGADSLLSWKVWKCKEVTLSTKDGTPIPIFTENGTGSVSVRPTVTTTYVLSATGDDGAVRTSESTVQVILSTPKILSFESDQKRLTPEAGESATLTWSTVDGKALSLLANGQILTDTHLDPTGSLQVSPSETTVYTLVLTGTDGTSQSKSLTIAVLPEDTPNVLLFLVDDMGWQDTSVPFYYKEGKSVTTTLNNFYKTPSMERLAAQGTKFTNAYASPVCSPARTSLMTGKTPAHTRVTNWTALQTPVVNEENGELAHMRAPEWNMGGMSHSEIPLPRVLQDAGYRTISVGKAHFAPNSEEFADPTKLGFAVNIAGSGLGGPGSYRSDENFQKGNAAQQVPGMDKYHTKGTGPSEEQKKANFLTNALTTEMKAQISQAVRDNVPFFAYMTHYAVHATHADPDPNGDYNSYLTNPSLPGATISTGTLRNFATLIEGMDKSLGDLMDHLKTLGVARKTLVIFLSDNGGDAPIQQTYGGNVIPYIEQVGAISPLRGRKGSRYEGGTRVPMIVGWAEIDENSRVQKEFPIPRNAVNHDMVAIWDLYPTILNLIHLPVPEEQVIDGEDLTPYFKGDSEFHRTQRIYHHFPHRHTYANFYSSVREGDWKVIFNYMDQYPNINLYAGAGYEKAGRFPWQLFNLKEDISESNDLAQNPEHQARLMRMARLLMRDLAKVDAQYPLLRKDNKTIGTGYIRMPALPHVDSDGDGVPDLIEDSNGNGLLDPGETDPDEAASVIVVNA